MKPSAGAALDGRALEEERRRHFQNARKLLQPAGADAIGALLVFLHLLESYVERVGQFALAEADHQTAHPDPRPDVTVDRVWGSYSWKQPIPHASARADS